MKDWKDTDGLRPIRFERKHRFGISLATREVYEGEALSEEHSRLLKVNRTESSQDTQSQTMDACCCRRCCRWSGAISPSLVPTNRTRVQSMRGFDECYTDIVDYIVRCTHKIWDERDVGLIYTHYTHNCVLYGVLGTMYDRESVVRETDSAHR